jgi:hypothetical protein
MSATRGRGEPGTPAQPFGRRRRFPVSFSFRRVRQTPRVLARAYLSLSRFKSTLTRPRIFSYPTTVRRAVTPVRRRRRLPHFARSRCFPNPEGSPWSLHSSAGFLRGREGYIPPAISSLAGRKIHPRPAWNRDLPFLSPAHQTTSAPADVRKRSEIAGAALLRRAPRSERSERRRQSCCYTPELTRHGLLTHS